MLISRSLTALSWIGSLCSAIVLACMAIYLRGKQGNHTAFEPWLLSVVFAPTTAVGLFALVRRSPRWGAALACGTGITGLLLLICLDRLNILVQYDRWLERGMP